MNRNNKNKKGMIGNHKLTKGGYDMSKKGKIKKK